MKFIIGKKIDMTQIWQGEKVFAVTRVSVDPCVITQVKNEEKDGYVAVQVGCGSKKEKNIRKPQKGHLAKLKKANKELDSNLRYLREFRLDNADELKVGDQIDIASFESGDKVQATATSKGKGFQGVVKRYGFSGGDKSHGNKDQLRMPGSIGATGPAHVFKGMRMAGRMGGDRVTVKNLEIAEVDVANNILSIKGAIPGARNTLVLISGEGDIKLVENKKVEKEDVKVEEVKEEKEVSEGKAEVKEDVKVEENKEKKVEEKKNDSAESDDKEANNDKNN